MQPFPYHSFPSVYYHPFVPGPPRSFVPTPFVPPTAAVWDPRIAAYPGQSSYVSRFAYFPQPLPYNSHVFNNRFIPRSYTPHAPPYYSNVGANLASSNFSSSNQASGQPTKNGENRAEPDSYGYKEARTEGFASKEMPGPHPVNCEIPGSEQKERKVGNSTTTVQSFETRGTLCKGVEELLNKQERSSKIFCDMQTSTTDLFGFYSNDDAAESSNEKFTIPKREIPKITVEDNLRIEVTKSEEPEFWWDNTGSDAVFPDHPGKTYVEEETDSINGESVVGENFSRYLIEADHPAFGEDSWFCWDSKVECIVDPHMEDDDGTTSRDDSFIEHFICREASSVIHSFSIEHDKTCCETFNIEEVHSAEEDRDDSDLIISERSELKEIEKQRHFLNPEESLDFIQKKLLTEDLHDEIDDTSFSKSEVSKQEPRNYSPNSSYKLKRVSELASSLRKQAPTRTSPNRSRLPISNRRKDSPFPESMDSKVARKPIAYKKQPALKGRTSLAQKCRNDGRGPAVEKTSRIKVMERTEKQKQKSNSTSKQDEARGKDHSRPSVKSLIQSFNTKVATESFVHSQTVSTFGKISKEKARRCSTPASSPALHDDKVERSSNEYKGRVSEATTLAAAGERKEQPGNLSRKGRYSLKKKKNSANQSSVATRKRLVTPKPSKLKKSLVQLKEVDRIDSKFEKESVVSKLQPAKAMEPVKPDQFPSVESAPTFSQLENISNETFDWETAAHLWDEALSRFNTSPVRFKGRKTSFKKGNKRMPSIRAKKFAFPKEWRRTRSLPTKSADGRFRVMRKRSAYPVETYDKLTFNDRLEKVAKKRNLMNENGKTASKLWQKKLEKFKKLINTRNHTGALQNTGGLKNQLSIGRGSKPGKEEISVGQTSTIGSPETVRSSQMDHKFFTEVDILNDSHFLGESFCIERCTFIGSAAQGVYLNSQTGQIMESSTEYDGNN